VSNRDARLNQMLAAAEREGASLLFKVRTLAILAVYGYFLLINPWNAELLYQESFSLAFFAIGLASYVFAVSRPEYRALVYVLGVLDLVLLVYIVLASNPFDPSPPYPMALFVREGSFQYLLIFVALSALTLSPKLVLFMGVAASIVWGLAIAWLLRQPGIQSDLLVPHESMSRADEISMFLSPNFVSIRNQIGHIVVMLIVAGILAAVVWRSRRFMMDYLSAERARTNLARHFSPNVVDELATRDQPFGPVRKQDIAVLFADIVGFTKFSEEHAPEDVFELLRQFHQKMEQVIFQHHGTLDNYIGDCVMATFGVPRASPADASNAIACGIAMIAELERWNAERLAQSLPAVDARIGIQHGSVVLGELGSERSLSFAVIGDACNVASRLQALCRDLEADLCVGHACLEASSQDYGSVARVFGLEDAGLIELRGRAGAIRVWKKPRAPD
jgi:adenylate cyclase